jgi:hypothetical protein
MNRKQNEYRIMNMNNRPSTVPVKFRDYKDSVMRVARILGVPTVRSSFKPRGDHLGRVHSDQMVLEMIRRARLVW